jgi:hypothetical protein
VEPVWNWNLTPMPLGMAAVPAAFSPMLLPLMVLGEPLQARMPAVVLPEIRLPAPEVLPPTVTLPALKMSTP